MTTTNHDRAVQRMADEIQAQRTADLLMPCTTREEVAKVIAGVGRGVFTLLDETPGAYAPDYRSLDWPRILRIWRNTIDAQPDLFDVLDATPGPTAVINRTYLGRHTVASMIGLAYGWDGPEPGTLGVHDRLLLIQENRTDGRLWLTVHRSMQAVLEEIDGDDDGDWTTDRLVDLQSDSELVVPTAGQLMQVLLDLVAYAEAGEDDAPDHSGADIAAEVYALAELPWFVR
jgi:hypothetical protein